MVARFAESTFTFGRLVILKLQSPLLLRSTKFFRLPPTASRSPAETLVKRPLFRETSDNLTPRTLSSG